MLNYATIKLLITNIYLCLEDSELKQRASFMYNNPSVFDPLRPMNIF